MNQKLHSVPPAPGNIGNLNIDYFHREKTTSFLFEPKKLIQYQHSWDWQKDTQRNLLEKPFSPQSVWLLQHFPCYTLGRGSKKQNLLFEEHKAPAPIYRIERGGEVTHHLPGQLVGYLVLDLHNYQTDLNWYLRKLEQVLIDVLARLDLPGERIPGLTGVWCKGFKVASIGIGCRRWITQHGFSLNVDCNLSGFRKIIPCGLQDHKIGKLNYWIPGITVEDVQPVVKKVLKELFEFTWINSSVSY